MVTKTVTNMLIIHLALKKFMVLFPPFYTALTTSVTPGTGYLIKMIFNTTITIIVKRAIDKAFVSPIPKNLSKVSPPFRD